MDNHQKANLILKIALWASILILPLLIFFLWKSPFSIDVPIDHGKFGTFGDFIGGVFGSAWALAGVVLFYIALKDQKEDIGLNRDALEKQVTALEVQTKEFQLQHKELAETRKVFTEQSNILKKQSFESTYFSLIDLYQKLVADLNSQSKSGKYFSELVEEITIKSNVDATTPIQTHQNIKETFLDIYNHKNHELSHYYKTLFRIVKIIDESMIDDHEKLFYIKILRSQLSENELLALYYNSHTDLSNSFYVISLRYNLFKHLPCISKIEFNDLINKGDITKQLNFANSFFLRISSFLNELGRISKNEDFDTHKISFEVPLLYDACIIAISASDQNEMKVRLSTTKDTLDKHNYFGLKFEEFKTFFILLLWNMFVFSTYSEKNFGTNDIHLSSTESPDTEMIVSIKSTRKLFLNSDS